MAAARDRGGWVGRSPGHFARGRECQTVRRSQCVRESTRRAHVIAAEKGARSRFPELPRNVPSTLAAVNDSEAGLSRAAAANRIPGYCDIRAGQGPVGDLESALRRRRPAKCPRRTDHLARSVGGICGQRPGTPFAESGASFLAHSKGLPFWADGLFRPSRHGCYRSAEVFRDHTDPRRVAQPPRRPPPRRAAIRGAHREQAQEPGRSPSTAPPPGPGYWNRWPQPTSGSSAPSSASPAAAAPRAPWHTGVLYLCIATCCGPPHRRDHRNLNCDMQVQ